MAVEGHVEKDVERKAMAPPHACLVCGSEENLHLRELRNVEWCSYYCTDCEPPLDGDQDWEAYNGD